VGLVFFDRKQNDILGLVFFDRKQNDIMGLASKSDDILGLAFDCFSGEKKIYIPGLAENVKQRTSWV